METGTASCFAPLAADRLRRPPFARLTSPLKTRVRGFCRSASGRSSSRRHRTSINATGLRGCGYKTASGRGKWPNKDPLYESGFKRLRNFTALRGALGEREGADLYEFVLNNPINKGDIFGLAAFWQPCSGILSSACFLQCMPEGVKSCNQLTTTLWNYGDPKTVTSSVCICNDPTNRNPPWPLCPSPDPSHKRVPPLPPVPPILPVLPECTEIIEGICLVLL